MLSNVICAFMFYSNTNLICDELLGEESHKCDQCLATFTRKGHFNVHKRIHTGFLIKPQVCFLFELRISYSF